MVTYDTNDVIAIVDENMMHFTRLPVILLPIRLKYSRVRLYNAIGYITKKS